MWTNTPNRILDGVPTSTITPISSKIISENLIVPGAAAKRLRKQRLICHGQWFQPMAHARQLGSVAKESSHFPSTAASRKLYCQWTNWAPWIWNGQMLMLQQMNGCMDDDCIHAPNGLLRWPTGRLYKDGWSANGSLRCIWTITKSWLRLLQSDHRLILTIIIKHPDKQAPWTIDLTLIW